MKTKFLILIFLLFLYGCATFRYDGNIGRATAQRINLVGLSKAEAVERFGNPYNYFVSYNEFIGTTETLTYKYTSLIPLNETRMMTIIITNGIVSNVFYSSDLPYSQQF